MTFLPRFIEPPCIVDRRRPVQADWFWFLSDLGFRDVRNTASRISIAQGIATFQGEA
ncbi:hypothetical protein [Bradyrhizobium sp. USDA 4452]